MTKLDSLIEVLTETGVEQQELNLIIIDYFSNQDTTDFGTEEGTYKVLTPSELDEELYTESEDKFFEAKDELENKTYEYSEVGASTLGKLVKAIDQETAIQYIKEDMDYEEQFDVKLVGETKYHQVYLIN